MPGSITACAVRATRLDSNGEAASGTNAYIVSDGLIRLVVSPRYTEAPSTILLDIWGDVVVNAPENPEMLGIDLAISLSGVDPALVAFLAEGCSRIDRTVPVGLRLRSGRDINARYALETWTIAVDSDGACINDKWHYWVFSRVRAGALTAWSFENAPLEFGLSGSAQAGLASWSQGPYTPFPSDEVITAGDFAVHALTSVPPPVATLGLASL